jgi:probable Rubsico expression protein CbbX
MKLSLKDEFKKTNIKEIFVQLDEDLVGLLPVKSRIKEIAALLLVEKLRNSLGFGLKSASVGLHMSFTGNPGTGKTIIAARMADILFKLGYISKGHLITVTRDDLVGQYIGHTAPKTKEVLKRARDGVLFIDEAYYLYKADNERDYGGEAIEILLQVMENQRENLVIIFAGYKDRMETFYKSNPGLSSRVTNHIDFPDYTVQDLCVISELLLEEEQYKVAPSAKVILYDYIGQLKTLPFFANARTVRNLVDKLRMIHADRIFNSERNHILTKGDLSIIVDEDVSLLLKS